MQTLSFVLVAVLIVLLGLVRHLRYKGKTFESILAPIVKRPPSICLTFLILIPVVYFLALVIIAGAISTGYFCHHHQ